MPRWRNKGLQGRYFKRAPDGLQFNVYAIFCQL